MNDIQRSSLVYALELARKQTLIHYHNWRTYKEIAGRWKPTHGYGFTMGKASLAEYVKYSEAYTHCEVLADMIGLPFVLRVEV